MNESNRAGRLRAAPEMLTTRQLEARSRRRFLAMGGAMAAGAALPAAAAPEGEEAILKLPKHSVTLGRPVAERGYGTSSKFEQGLQRRQSPGLTRVNEASVSFTPLQGLFGIITPSGLHFERHHQGWHDIDPTRHRLMVTGLVASARLHAGRPHAPAFGHAYPFHRVRREHRHGMAQCCGAHGAVGAPAPCRKA